MSRGRILLITDDEWDLTLLRKYLADAGFSIETARDARSGFERAKQARPDCVLCAAELPDIDGFWVLGRLRGEGPQLSRVPFVLLMGVDDRESRRQALGLGADLVLAPPYHEDDVVQQVSAVVGMASRFGAEPSGVSSVQPAGSVAFEGDLQGMSLTTLLTLLDMERRSGTLTIGGDEIAVLELHTGSITAATLGGAERSAIEVVRACFGWQKGRFHFTARKPASSGPPSGERVSALLLEVMQFVDEAGRGDDF